MRTPNWKPVNLPEQDGYTIVLSFLPEHTKPREAFSDWSDEDYKQISSMYWFTVEVQAFRDGKPEGAAYLGGNCYKSKKDAVESELSGYLTQLVREAVQESDN